MSDPVGLAQIYPRVSSGGTDRLRPESLFAATPQRHKLAYMDHPRITMTPGIMGGRPCIRGTRITVEALVDHLASGETMAELLEGYPGISEEDVRAALAFAADHLRTQGFVAV